MLCSPKRSELTAHQPFQLRQTAIKSHKSTSLHFHLFTTLPSSQFLMLIYKSIKGKSIKIQIVFFGFISKDSQELELERMVEVKDKSHFVYERARTTRKIIVFDKYDTRMDGHGDGHPPPNLVLHGSSSSLLYPLSHSFFQFSSLPFSIILITMIINVHFIHRILFLHCGCDFFLEVSKNLGFCQLSYTFVSKCTLVVIMCMLCWIYANF